MSTRVQLVHWNATEATRRVAALRKTGFVVRYAPFEPFPAAFKRLKAEPPDALVIDLGRLPSAGRDVALAVREAKALRHIPIVFVEGDAAKVQGIRKHLPDATYTTWRGVRSAIRAAIAKPPADPVVPSSRLAGYSGTALPRKLGIKPDATVALVRAPEGFESLLAPMPPGVTFRRDARAVADLTVWFVRSRSELEGRIVAMSSRVGRDGMWIAWPKKASGVRSDVSEPIVRGCGLANGLVDYKIAAIDETWSGLKFAVRRAKRP